MRSIPCPGHVRIPARRCLRLSSTEDSGTLARDAQPTPHRGGNYPPLEAPDRTRRVVRRGGVGELRRPARHARFAAARSAASWPAAAGAVLRRNTISRQLPDESWTVPVIPFR